MIVSVVWSANTRMPRRVTGFLAPTSPGYRGAPDGRPPIGLTAQHLGLIGPTPGEQDGSSGSRSTALDRVRTVVASYLMRSPAPFQGAGSRIGWRYASAQQECLLSAT
jgi:hypothetical protein